MNQQVDWVRLKVLFKSAKLLVLLLRLENRHRETRRRQIIQSKSAFQIKPNPFSIFNTLTMSVVMQLQVFANSAYLNFIFSFSENYCENFCKFFSISIQKVTDDSPVQFVFSKYCLHKMFCSSFPLYPNCSTDQLKID